MNNILLSQLYKILRQICPILFPQYHASAHYFQVTVNVNFHRALQLMYGNNLCFVTATTYYVFRRLFFCLCMFQEYL